MSSRVHDHEYQDYIIERVVSGGKDGYELHFDGGMCCWAPKTDVKPRKGSHLRLYGRGFGSTIRGMEIDGHVVYYRTEEEDREHHLQLSIERSRKQRAEFNENAEATEIAYLNLPTPFRARIARFRRMRSDFDVDHLGYELFTCQEAVKIAAHCGTADAIQAFHDLPYEKQKCVISDQHSGNTFGKACNLAYAYLTNPAILEEMHGALCPLVGCEEYGCYAATKDVIA